MAQVESGGGRGRKVGVELNLVPFIDLMSVLITFLLLTAVWTQVSMIQIGTSIYGKKSEETPVIPPDADLALRIDITETGYAVVLGKETFVLPMKENKYDSVALLERLQQAKLKFPAKEDAAIAMSDQLPYELLIDGMDVLLKAGFPRISVLTGGPK
jgi:biopolymer transport protein TolR